jgi:hypothetical protein
MSIFLAFLKQRLKRSNPLRRSLRDNIGLPSSFSTVVEMAIPSVPVAYNSTSPQIPFARVPAAYGAASREVRIELN